MPTRRKNKQGLTPKQDLFVKEYLKDLNATAAARRAGYSEKTAKTIGQENTTKPAIQQALQKAMAKRAGRTEISADRVLRELALLAFADMGELGEWEGTFVNLFDSKQLTDAQRRTIKSISSTQGKFGPSVRVETHSKIAALQMLLRHLGIDQPDPSSRPDLVPLDWDGTPDEPVDEPDERDDAAI